MAEQCILWFDPDQSMANCHWLVLDAQGNRIGHPQEGSLGDAARICTDRKTTVLLPGERIRDVHVNIPGKNPQKLLQAAPFALEDRFAEDVEDLHFALLDRDNGRQRFLVTDIEWLQQAMRQLDDHGIRPASVLPDYLGVERNAASEHWVITDSRLLAIDDSPGGFAADIQYAEGLWPAGEDNKPAITLQEGVELADSLRNEASALEILSVDALLTRMGRTAAAMTNPGLLQGPFRTRKEGSESLRRWRPVARLAAALVLVLAISWGIDVWRLNAELATLEKQAEQQFRRILPDARMGGDPRGRVESLLRGGASEENLALDMIAALGVSLAETGDARLQAFSFRGKRLEFSVMVKNAEKLEALRQSLESRGALRVNIASANAQGDALEGRLTVEAVQ